MKVLRSLFSVFLVIILVCMFACLGIAETRKASLGGQDSDGNYHFTVDTTSSSDEGILSGAEGSTVELTPNVSISSTGADATQATATTATSGRTYIFESAAQTIFFLPDCASQQLEYTVVAADANKILIDTGVATDTINYLTLDAGDGLASNSAIGDTVTLQCYKANTWLPTKMGSSAWTDAGPLFP